MNRIKRANRLAWESAPRPFHDLTVDRERDPVIGGREELLAHILDRLGFQFTDRFRTVQGTFALDERQVGSNDHVSGQQPLADSLAAFLAEEP